MREVCAGSVCVPVCVHKGVCTLVCEGCVCVQSGVRLSLSLVYSLELMFRKAWFAEEEGGTIDCSEAISQGWHLKGGVRH